MKILFFSDIHGVPETLESLFRFDDELKPELLVLLGDALYHGPRNGVPPLYDPRRVAELLNARKERILAVRGNCDSEVDQFLLDFPIRAEFSEVFADGLRFFVTHGHIWNESRLPPVSAGTILAQGHTHVPVLKELPGGVTLFNPGSITLPKAGAPRTFGFSDGGALTVRKLEDGSVFLAR